MGVEFGVPLSTTGVPLESPILDPDPPGTAPLSLPETGPEFPIVPLSPPPEATGGAITGVSLLPPELIGGFSTGTPTIGEGKGSVEGAGFEIAPVPGETGSGIGVVTGLGITTGTVALPGGGIVPESDPPWPPPGRGIDPPSE